MIATNAIWLLFCVLFNRRNPFTILLIERSGEEIKRKIAAPPAEEFHSLFGTLILYITQSVGGFRFGR